MSCKTGFKPDKYFIAQLWYETGYLSRVYHIEHTLEDLLSITGKSGYKIVFKNKNNDWIIVAHWYKDHWKMDKNYGTI